MGYKVTNIAAIVSEEKNLVMDTIFFFQTKEAAEEYYQLVISADEKFPTKKVRVLKAEHILKPMTADENKKFNFAIPATPINMTIPHKTIKRPLVIPENEPHWIETQELVWPNKKLRRVK